VIKEKPSPVAGGTTDEGKQERPPTQKGGLIQTNHE